VSGPATGTAPGALRDRLLLGQRDHSARLAPDGGTVAFLRSTVDGPELWLRAGDGGERRLAAMPGATVTELRWTADSAVLLYRHATRGRESGGLAALRVATGEPVPLAPPGPVQEYWLGDTDPAAVVFACRPPGSKRAELFRAALNGTAEPVPLGPNPGFHRWLVDGRLRPRGGIRLAADGSARVLLGDDPATARTVLALDAAALPDFAALRFSRDGERLFVISSAGAATRRLVAVTATGTAETVFAHPDLDLEGYPVAPDGVWFDPRTAEPDLCSVMDQRLRYHPLPPREPAGLAWLADNAAGTRVLVDRSADDRTWLVAEVHDRGPLVLHRYRPAADRAEQVLVNRPELVGVRLPGLTDLRFEASDGRPLTGYALRPLDAEPPYPTVVLVHGGPAGRDTWRFHAEAQFLAAAGYLSLHVNYRGSRGFGTAFREAGNGEWGGRMQQDLYDAVAHGVATGLVDPDRVAFLGGSYGGYAALLAAATRTDLVRCAVAISPPCDLVALATAPPAYWQPLAGSLLRQLLRRPDGGTVDEDTLRRRSPAHVLTAGCAPLLVAQGERDPRVPVADVDAFVERATGLGVDVRYLRFPDEGHLVRADRNRAELFGAVVDFLEAHDGRR
jgi:dipeptidyl aminopeptidase/acylaminoacyl peptidase